MLRFWGQIRTHVVHKELRESLPGNTCIAGQWPRGNAMILAGQRRSQCVVANFAFHVIGDKVVSEIIDIFLKNLVWSLAQCHVNILVIYRGPSAFIYQHIWLQRGTCYNRQHLYGQTCKNNKTSYQWLNVEQKNACLLRESVENSDAAPPRMDF